MIEYYHIIMTDEKIYYRSILDNLTGGLIGVDLEGNVAYMNRMAGQILHMTEEDCLNKKFGAAFVNYPELKGVITETMATGKTVRRAEVKISHAGTPMVIGYGTMLVKNGEEEYGFAVIFQDISFTGKK